MKRFKRILVGVDLSKGDALVSRELAPPSQEAVEQALWLAKLSSARLLFMHSLDVSAKTQRLIQENQGLDSPVVDKAQVVLETLVERARQEGVVADCGWSSEWVG